MTTLARWILGLGILGSLWASSTVFSADPTPTSSAQELQYVQLTIDYGDGAQKRFPKVPWHAEMKALDAMFWAEKHPHGITIRHRGKNALAIVGQIDDLKNGGGDKKNWIFYVNDQLAKQSCGATRLQPQDRILWRYEVYK